jgi:mono/diheme cytochrome c family protein
MRNVYLSAAFISIAALAGSVGPANAADANIPEAFENAGCWSCHGYRGQGGREGPKIAHLPLDYAGFSTWVRTTSGDMPPYTARILPDADLRTIYDYLQNIPEPPTPDTVPILQNIYTE